MGLFDMFRRPYKTVIADDSKLRQQLYADLTMPDITFNVDSGRKLSAMIICSKILSQDIARLPLKLYLTSDDGTRTILKDDYRHLLLKSRPNSYTDSFTFWGAVEFTRNMEGNAYVKINRDATNGKILDLELIPHENVKGPVKVKNELYYEVSTKVKEDEIVKKVIPSRDILHFRNVTTSGLRGQDPKIDLKVNLSLSYKGLIALDKFYQNGAITSKGLETIIPENISQTKWQEQMSSFLKNKVGITNAGEWLVFPPFTKLVEMKLDFANAQFIETVKYNNSQVASYYGIPQHKIGNNEYNNYNNLKEMQDDYIKNTIGPIVMMYRRELEFKLLSDTEMNDGYSIEFETNALNITDSKTRIENYRSLFGMAAISPQTIKKLENLPDDGETFIATGYMGLDKARGKTGEIDEDKLKGDV